MYFVSSFVLYALVNSLSYTFIHNVGCRQDVMEFSWLKNSKTSYCWNKNSKIVRRKYIYCFRRHGYAYNHLNTENQ